MIVAPTVAPAPTPAPTLPSAYALADLRPRQTFFDYSIDYSVDLDCLVWIGPARSLEFRRKKAMWLTNCRPEHQRCSPVHKHPHGLLQRPCRCHRHQRGRHSVLLRLWHALSQLLLHRGCHWDLFQLFSRNRRHVSLRQAWLAHSSVSNPTQASVNTSDPSSRTSAALFRLVLWPRSRCRKLVACSAVYRSLTGCSARACP